MSMKVGHTTFFLRSGTGNAGAARRRATAFPGVEFCRDSPDCRQGGKATQARRMVRANGSRAKRAAPMISSAIPIKFRCEEDGFSQRAQPHPSKDQSILDSSVTSRETDLKSSRWFLFLSGVWSFQSKALPGLLRLLCQQLFCGSKTWSSRGSEEDKLISFHLAWNGGLLKLVEPIEEKYSTKRATRRYRSVLGGQLYTASTCGTPIVSTDWPAGIRLG